VTKCPQHMYVLTYCFVSADIQNSRHLITNLITSNRSAVSGNANLVARKIAEKVPPGNM
jgi:hypothetical protein